MNDTYNHTQTDPVQEVLYHTASSLHPQELRNMFLGNITNNKSSGRRKVGC